jgi:hypothetical protein
LFRVHDSIQYGDRPARLLPEQTGLRPLDPGFVVWWEWVENRVDSPLTIPAYLHDAALRLDSEQRLNRVLVNETVSLADPDAQR